MKNLTVFLILFFSTALLYAQEPLTETPVSTSASEEKRNIDGPNNLPNTQQDKIGKMIEFKTPDGKITNAYVLESQVDSDDYLFVIHEWWGLDGFTKRIAEKYYSDLGTVNVIAIDLYDGRIAETQETASKYMEQVDDRRAKAIVEGVLDYAGNSSEIATIGWGFGGTWALRAAMLAGSEAQGAVMYYGMPEKDLQKIKENVNFPVLGIFAKKEEWIKPEIVEKFKEDMEVAQKELNVHFYEAKHAFANPNSSNFDKKASEDAYKKSLAFLKRVLD